MPRTSCAGNEHTGTDTGGGKAAQDSEFALCGEVHRNRDQAKRCEHHADVAGEVVIARRDATEVGIGTLPEDAGEDEHCRQWEADQADGDHGFSEDQA